MTRPAPTDKELAQDFYNAIEQAELHMVNRHQFDQARYIGSLTAELVESIRLARTPPITQRECAAVLIEQILSTIPVVYGRPKKNENATVS